jgi:hypothetical protein
MNDMTMNRDISQKKVNIKINFKRKNLGVKTS